MLAGLLGVTGLSLIKRAANPGGAQSSGACCPLMPGPEAMPAAAGADAADTHSVADQVIAYYFHGTVRCETCLTIEQRAKAVIEEQFGADLAAERMVFMPVDYDLPENARYLTDYSLPCPSLVLVRQADGKAGEWKLLGDTWQLVHEPFQLDHYVETEMRNFLRGPHLPAITTPLGASSAPESR
ncbi:MAG: nitrophenyl compound nitroreductase subunit ArsF family protein [Limisphaerales bacterium]